MAPYLKEETWKNGFYFWNFVILWVVRLKHTQTNLTDKLCLTYGNVVEFMKLNSYDLLVFLNKNKKQTQILCFLPICKCHCQATSLTQQHLKLKSGIQEKKKKTCHLSPAIWLPLYAASAAMKVQGGLLMRLREVLVMNRFKKKCFGENNKIFLLSDLIQAI